MANWFPVINPFLLRNSLVRGPVCTLLVERQMLELLWADFVSQPKQSQGGRVTWQGDWASWQISSCCWRITWQIPQFCLQDKFLWIGSNAEADWAIHSKEWLLGSILLFHLYLMLQEELFWDLSRDPSCFICSSCAIWDLEDEVGCFSSSFWMTVNCGVHPAVGQGSLSEGSQSLEKRAGRKRGI